MAIEVEIRCPSDLRRLFMKLQISGEKPKYVDGNLLEIACSDCKRELRKQGVEIVRVLHYFNFVGELITTEVVRGEPADSKGD